ncbi:MAG: nucleotidyltransferase family protein [Bacteroidota bacterium]
MKLKHSTEQQVLLRILKGEIPSHLNNVNVDGLYNLFQRHRLFPIASEIIHLLDEKSRGRWKNTIQVHTIRSLHLTSILHKIVGAYKSKGIEAIPLKGPVLSQRLYGNTGSRHFVDLDILIRGEEIIPIIEIAKGLGLTLRFPKQDLLSNQWSYYFRYKKDIGLFWKEHGVFVELHTGIDNYELLDDTEENPLWEALSEQKMGSTHFHVMNHGSSFLYMAFHGAFHQYFRLFWLRDVAEALNSWELDHQKILSDARSLGIERLLGVTLLLTKEYFGIKIPDEYQGYFRSDYGIIQKLSHNCMKRIRGPEKLSFTGKLNRHYYMLLLKPGLHYKWNVIKSLYHRWYIAEFLGGH